MLTNTVTLCRAGSCCPTMTQIKDNQFSITDDYGATQTFNSSTLVQFAMQCNNEYQPNDTVTLGSLKMTAEQGSVIADYM